MYTVYLTLYALSMPAAETDADNEMVTAQIPKYMFLACSSTLCIFQFYRKSVKYITSSLKQNIC